MKKLLALFILPSLVIADISFDTASSNSGAPPAASLTWAHTSTGPERVLVVGVNALGTTTTGVTYDGVAMTSVNAQAYGSNEVSTWYLVGPNEGAHNVIVTLAGASSGVQGGSITLLRVDQTNPIDANNTATGSGTTATVSVTTVNDNAWICDVVGHGLGPSLIAVGGSQISRWEREATPGAAGGSTLGPVSPAGSTAMSWTFSFVSGDWGHSAVSLKPAPRSSIQLMTEMGIGG